MSFGFALGLGLYSLFAAIIAALAVVLMGSEPPDDEGDDESEEIEDEDYCHQEYGGEGGTA